MPVPLDQAGKQAEKDESRPDLVENASRDSDLLTHAAVIPGQTCSTLRPPRVRHGRDCEVEPGSVDALGRGVVNTAACVTHSRYPAFSDLGLAEHVGAISVPGETIGALRELEVTICLHAETDDAPAVPVEAEIVLELIDLAGQTVAAVRGEVTALTPNRQVNWTLSMPATAPAEYIRRLIITRPDAAPLVFEAPLTVPVQEFDAELSLQPGPTSAGDLPEMTLRNTGPNPVWYGERYALERRGDNGQWTPVPLSAPGERRGFRMYRGTLAPNQSFTQRTRVPLHAELGRHRFSKTVASEHVNKPSRSVTDEFDIV
jgi:hypothetical protein